jgi:hypothetical protein
LNTCLIQKGVSQSRLSSDDQVRSGSAGINGEPFWPYLQSPYGLLPSGPKREELAIYQVGPDQSIKRGQIKLTNAYVTNSDILCHLL